MLKKVLLTIKGLQQAFDAEPHTEMTVIGRYGRRGRSHFVYYRDPDDEADETNIAGAHMIKIGGEMIEVVRKRGGRMHILFEKDQGSAAVYSTDAGNLLLNIFTNALDVEETDEAIRAHLTYSLTMNEVFISDCDVDIEIRFLPDQEEELFEE